MYVDWEYYKIFYYVAKYQNFTKAARGEIVQLHLREIIPQRSICLVYDHHRPLNTAARKFQKLLTSPEETH